MISATLIGHLGAEPEPHTTPNGTRLTRLRVASKHGFGDRQSTSWVSVAVFGKAAEFCERYLHKGDLVAITGKVYMQTWTDKQGVEKQTLACDADSVDSIGGKRDDRGNPPERRPVPTKHTDETDPLAF